MWRILLIKIDFGFVKQNFSYHQNFVCFVQMLSIVEMMLCWDRIFLCDNVNSNSCAFNLLVVNGLKYIKCTEMCEICKLWLIKYFLIYFSVVMNHICGFLSSLPFLKKRHCIRY